MPTTVHTGLGLATALAGLIGSPAQAQAQNRPAPPTDVEVRYGQWVDPARDGRVVPYKVYLPKGARGPVPVIVHSHGLGGSREGSTFILTALAQAGFAAVALQHAGSDSSLGIGQARSEEAIVAAGARGITAAAAQARYGDVPFALDQLTREASAGGSLAGRIDLARLGMSGHSFGALSTLVAVGQRVLGAPSRSYAEPRIKAAIAYSPNKPRNDDAATAFASVKTPMLHMTGTEDKSPMDLEGSPFERTAPFQMIRGSDQYLVVLDGGDHGVFGGPRTAPRPNRPRDAEHMALVKAETIRFWRAQLAGDTTAAKELCTLPARVKAVADGYVKAARCGPPTPIRPLA